MADKIDIPSFQIAASKMRADGNAYFKLFEKHVPRNLDMNSVVLLYKLDNLSCIYNIINMNSKTHYVVASNTAVNTALQVVLDKSIDVKYIEELDFKKTDMKFDCIIMNPPYSRNLHIKILAEAIKHLKDEKSVCVNLSPVRWLQDPLAKYKKNCDLKRFEESVAKHIESLDIMSAQAAQNLFSIVLGADLGVYACRAKQYEIKDYSIWPFKAAVLEYIISHNPTYEQDKADGWRVRMPVMTGASGRAHGCGDRPEILSSFGKLLAFKDGKTEDGKWWYDCYKKNQNFKPTPTITRSIKFDSKAEAENFIKQFDTSFGKFVTDILTGYVGIGPECCLWMSDAINPRTGIKGYKGEWTDEDLVLYFGITPEEQKTIEKTIEKYDTK